MLWLLFKTCAKTSSFGVKALGSVIELGSVIKRGTSLDTWYGWQPSRFIIIVGVLVFAQNHVIRCHAIRNLISGIWESGNLGVEISFLHVITANRNKCHLYPPWESDGENCSMAFYVIPLCIRVADANSTEREPFSFLLLLPPCSCHRAGFACSTLVARFDIWLARPGTRAGESRWCHSISKQLVRLACPHVFDHHTPISLLASR